MKFRILLGAFCLTMIAIDLEAGPLRRRVRSAPQYPMQQPDVIMPTVAPGSSPGVVTVSAVAAMPAGSGDGLEEVNTQRAARGLRPYVRDESLTQAAQRCAAFRAERGLFGHTSNDFAFLPAGVCAGSAGCAAYPASYGWMSCCVYDN